MYTHFNDGGRQSAGFKGKTGDCVVRAIAIATGKPYSEVYDALYSRSRQRALRRGKKARSPRCGVARAVYEPYLLNLGWRWNPCMKIGTGCRVHLRPDELPAGRLIVAVSKHLSAVIDGVIHDTFDPSRNGTRCVYGFYAPTAGGA